MVLFIIIAILLIIVCFVKWIQNNMIVRDCLYHFKHGNVIVCGHKGKGKDLLFQWVINKRHDYYYANISYGGNYHKVSIGDVNCNPNTYDNLINDHVVKSKHLFKEGKDIYISDAGNFLPSQMDSQLHKKYPSFPIFYSLSRHLYNNNVHCNTQSINRLWKALREQADYFVVCKRTYNFKLFLVIKTICYDKFESCQNGVLPLKKRLLNKESKNNFDLFTAQNGNVNYAYFFIPIWKIKYDTRAFEKIMLKGRRKK